MAKDTFHEAVKRALLKEGWTITHDPLAIRIGRVRLLIDLGAERVIAAERENQKIAIEIKSFSDESPVSAFHEAVGQYDNYRLALEDEDPERELFLAVPVSIYETFFQEVFIQKVLSCRGIKLIVYEPYAEVLTKWTH